jgi:hypothetical protein
MLCKPGEILKGGGERKREKRKKEKYLQGEEEVKGMNMGLALQAEK